MTPTFQDSATVAAAASITALRADIEQVDEALIGLVARRQELARAMARAKHVAGVPIVDRAREAAVVAAATERARAARIDEDTVRHIYWCLIDLSRRIQLGSTV